MIEELLFGIDDKKKADRGFQWAVIQKCKRECQPIPAWPWDALGKACKAKRTAA